MSLFHDVIIMFLFSWKLVGANMNVQAMLTQLFRKHFAHSGWWVLSLLLLLTSVMLNIPCLVDINVHVFEVDWWLFYNFVWPCCGWVEYMWVKVLRCFCNHFILCSPGDINYMYVSPALLWSWKTTLRSKPSQLDQVWIILPTLELLPLDWTHRRSGLRHDKLKEKQLQCRKMD